MAFRDWLLEQALEAERIDWEHKQAIAKADAKRAAKHLKRLKKARPPMYRPDPVVYKIIVVLGVRKGALGELEEFTEVVGTMSELEAERIAKAKAQALGFIYRGTISVERL